MFRLLLRVWRRFIATDRDSSNHVEHLEGRQLLSALPHAAATVPRYDHVVIVVEENHGFSQILGPSIWPPLAFNPIVWASINQPKPYLQDLYTRGLASGGAVFTDSHGIDHPSQPNYLALFSGSTQGVTSDA